MRPESDFWKAYNASYDPRVFERSVQEIYTFCRPDPPFPGFQQACDYKTRSEDTIIVPGFYRMEITDINRALREICPPVLSLWRTISDIGNSVYAPPLIDQKGVGNEGWGGVAAGQVLSKYFEGSDY